MDKLRGGNRHIEDRVKWSETHCFGGRAEGTRDSTLGSEFSGSGTLLIHEADYREACLLIGR
jgi:hypothetical protein